MESKGGALMSDRLLINVIMSNILGFSLIFIVIKYGILNAILISGLVVLTFLLWEWAKTPYNWNKDKEGTNGFFSHSGWEEN